MVNSRKAISTMWIIMILIAVTLVITIAVTTWLFSLWSSYQETFIVKPVVYVRQQALSTIPVLELYINNEGAKAEKILKIEIKATNGYYINETIMTIPAGFKGYIRIKEWTTIGNPEIIPGNIYRVYIYTESHGLMFLDILAEQS